MRLPAFNFPKIDPTWNFAVCSEIPSLKAIALLLAPSASIRNTSISRAVNPGPLASISGVVCHNIDSACSESITTRPAAIASIAA